MFKMLGGSLLYVSNATRFPPDFVGHLDLFGFGWTNINLENIKLFIATIFHGHGHVQKSDVQKNQVNLGQFQPTSVLQYILCWLDIKC